ncbi:unnamed protein product [Anisakis simplex]|uniref:Uncharacterized protein n=1 Tax=Anisakis simplex TaxID=6269 RepID=A0A0M3JG31_ANISI|nr:unnamed protein product [Anisakis simplex]
MDETTHSKTKPKTVTKSKEVSTKAVPGKKPKPVVNGNGTAVAVKSAPVAAATTVVAVKKLPPTGKKIPAPTRKPMKTIVEEGPSSKPAAATVKKSPRRSVRISSKAADGDIANPANSAPSTSGSGSAAEPAPGSGGGSAAETVVHRSAVGHRRHTIGAGVDRKSAAAGPATKRYFLENFLVYFSYHNFH